MSGCAFSFKMKILRCSAYVGWQLASDAVVFKVDSAYGLQMWYHERLKPWVHYIPVKADLSDLHQRFL